MDGVAIIRLALSILSERLLAVIALLLSFGLACWSMYDPTWERLATMAFFSVFSYLLINSRKRETNEKPERLAE